MADEKGSGLFQAIFGGLTAGAGYEDLKEMFDSAETRVNAGLDTAYTDATSQGTFKPYSMTSGIGSSGMDVNGNMYSNLGAGQQAYSNRMRTGAQNMYNQATGANPFAARGNTMYNRSLNNNFAGQAQNAFNRSQNNAFGRQAQNLFNRATGNNQMQNMGMQMSQRAMQSTAGREQDIYERARAMQRPGEDRQYSSMNADLFGGGRGGMASGEFGGSPEQMAFGKAQAEARNTASFNAMGQAQAEQMQQAQMGNQMYGQGMSERQMYEQMGAQRYGLGSQDQARQLQQGLSQYGLGQQNQQMYGQMGQAWQQQGLAQQGLQGQLAGQMGSAQYDPYNQLAQQNQQGLAGGQMMNQQGANMASLLAQLGIGRATTDVNLQNVRGDAAASMWEALGAAAGGGGSWLDQFFTDADGNFKIPGT